MFHSCPVCEPIVHSVGFLVGLIINAIVGGIDADYAAHFALAGYVIFNVIIGAKINLVTFDILSLIVVRPLSATIGAKVLAAILGAN